MHLQGPDSGDDHHRIRSETAETAFDIKELLSPEVSAEAGLRDDVIRQFQGCCGSDQGVAAMRNVGKRAAVDQHRGVFEGLHEVRLDRFLHDHGRGPVNMEVLDGNRLAFICVGHDAAADPFLEILQIVRQAEDGHDFGGNGNDKVVFPLHAVGPLLLTDCDIPQGAVVHIQAALPDDLFRVDVQRVALVHGVVQHGSDKVVAGGDGMHVTGEVQVDLFHRNNLGIAAAGRAALEAENRAQGWFTQACHDILVDFGQSVGQADGCGGFAFAGFGRGDGRHEDQFAVRTIFSVFPDLQGDLGLVGAIRLQVLPVNACLVGNDVNVFQDCSLGNAKIVVHVVFLHMGQPILRRSDRAWIRVISSA